MFESKVVWITGASSGIGEALAAAFAKAGAKLVLSARRRDELDRVAAKCGNAEVFVLPLDLTKTDELDALTAQALAKFGHIDVMVHNGGISQRSWVKDTELAVHRRLMEVNYFGAVALTHALLPSMLERKSGQFVVISSVMGKIGTPMRSSYAASKHALHGFFDCLRAEVTDAGLFVTLICPGFVATDVAKNALSADGKPTGHADEQVANGASAEATAKQILSAVASKKSEVYVGKTIGLERLALNLNQYLPSIFEKVIKNQVPK